MFWFVVGLVLLAALCLVLAIGDLRRRF